MTESELCELECIAQRIIERQNVSPSEAFSRAGQFVAHRDAMRRTLRDNALARTGRGSSAGAT